MESRLNLDLSTYKKTMRIKNGNPKRPWNKNAVIKRHNW